ncbi:uncharacterized protein [Nicotiana tomentosiformis]|uniref:uncharacterized protein n=1 Tax=Nicotiana tomentosiformis TaxID=4098 RepID=UPI00388C7C40
MGYIENMFKQIMEKNVDPDSQLASHNTSIRNLEVQMGKISQARNSRPKGALPSDTVVKPNGCNNMGHAMEVITRTRSGRGGNAPTSRERRLVDDDQVVQEEEIPNSVVQVNDEVRIDIDDSVEETQEEVNPSREHIIDIPELVVKKDKAPLPQPPPPYPQRLAKQNEALEQMLGYAKFMKALMTKKRSMNFETIKVTHQVSAIVHSMAPNLEDPASFMIPCTIGSTEFSKSLCDLVTSINLMPYSIFKTLEIRQLRPTSMRLQMVDRTMKRLLGVIEDVLVWVDKFILPTDLFILDCEVDYEMPIILGRPFLAIGKALCDVEVGEHTFRVGDEQVIFHVCKSMRKPNSNEVCSFVDLLTDVIVGDTSATINVGDMLEVIFLNFDDDGMDGFTECVNSLQGMGSYNYAPQNKIGS